MMWEGNGPWEHGGSWGAGGWLMGIGMLLAIVAVVVLVVLLVRMLSQPHTAAVGQVAPATTTAVYPAAPPAQATPPAAVAETPREIVQRRYAGGEFDREEYLQKLADL